MRIDAGGINRITLEGFQVLYIYLLFLILSWHLEFIIHSWQLIGVREKTMHEDYNSRTFENDVCILELEESFDFDGYEAQFETCLVYFIRWIIN